MTPAPQSTTADRRSDLLAAALRLVERQMPAKPIAYVWPEQDRVLFRTADGRTGDVEIVVLVNWDVARTESTAAGSNAP